MAFDVTSRLRNLETNPRKPQRLYLEVKWRLVWFREDHPDWGIETEIVSFDGQRAVCRAAIMDTEGRIVATGTKTETPAGFGDYLEKAETGAIGRALAAAGYGTQFAPELEEGLVRIVDNPVTVDTPTVAAWDGNSAPSVEQLQALARKANVDLDAALKAKGKTVGAISEDERLVLAHWLSQKGEG